MALAIEKTPPALDSPAGQHSAPDGVFVIGGGGDVPVIEIGILVELPAEQVPVKSRKFRDIIGGNLKMYRDVVHIYFPEEITTKTLRHYEIRSSFGLLRKPREGTLCDFVS